jgi:hypothetical protein
MVLLTAIDRNAIQQLCILRQPNMPLKLGHVFELRHPDPDISLPESIFKMPISMNHRGREMKLCHLGSFLKISVLNTQIESSPDA